MTRAAAARHNLVEEENEAQKEAADIGEKAHVKAQQHGRNEQRHAVEEAARGSLGVLPQHAAEEALREVVRLRGGFFLLGRMHRGVVHAARHLRDGRHDAVFGVVAMARVGDIEVGGDAEREERPGEQDAPGAGGFGVD